MIRPLQLQPPCRVRLTLALRFVYVVMFSFVIVFMVAFPAGVRKNPIGFHPLVNRPLHLQPPSRVWLTPAVYAF